MIWPDISVETELIVHLWLAIRLRSNSQKILPNIVVNPRTLWTCNSTFTKNCSTLLAEWKMKFPQQSFFHGESNRFRIKYDLKANHGNKFYWWCCDDLYVHEAIDIHVVYNGHSLYRNIHLTACGNGPDVCQIFIRHKL